MKIPLLEHVNLRNPDTSEYVAEVQECLDKLSSIVDQYPVQTKLDTLNVLHCVVILDAIQEWNISEEAAIKLTEFAAHYLKEKTIEKIQLAIQRAHQNNGTSH
jgi:hypothetical protein